MGRVPLQSVLATHSTQASAVVSHTLPAAAHTPGLPEEQGRQTPPAAQTGAAAPQSPSVTHARHVCVVPLHTGVAPLQSAEARHAAQTPPVVSHSGVGPVHAVLFVAEHAPQVPFGWQAAAEPPHSPSATQPRHTCVVPSHTGLAAWHCVFARHATHVPVIVWHVGLVATHAVAFVTEHAPHAPEGWHAGVAPPQSASPAQARHVLVPASQTGFVPPH
jgi:hypothetical protein